MKLHLLTHDVNQAEKFYNALLGLQIVFKNSCSISFSVGLSTLIFNHSNSNIKPSYHFAFNIPKNKLDEALVWTASRVDVLQVIPLDKIAHFDTWNAKSFYFYDYNGNVLEFIAHFDLDNKTNKPFDGSSILSISEIGLPVENVMDESKQILTDNNLVYFSKQPAGKNFAALGDDNGLLIFVVAESNWFPTNKPAKKYWTKIKEANNGTVTDIYAKGY